MDSQADLIKKYLLAQVPKHPHAIVSVTAEKFNVTRTTVHRHLAALIKKGLVLKSGTTRNICYYLQSSLRRKLSFKLDKRLSEFTVFKENFEEVFKPFKANIYDICLYGFTEIVNNAIDHSQGRTVSVSTEYANHCLKISIQDDGIGLFFSIYDYFKLEDIRESILQLSKGKTTTAPDQHSGEGIFFTSRVFDQFDLYANNMRYFRDNKERDWGLESLDYSTKGTEVVMRLFTNSERSVVSVFKQYQDADDLKFARTEILVKLSQYGDSPLISRSQAKRIIIGLEKFKHITLDFAGVRLVGQGFVDEIFRVFKNSYAEISIEVVNANSDVEFMIQRSISP